MTQKELSAIAKRYGFRAKICEDSKGKFSGQRYLEIVLLDGDKIEGVLALLTAVIEIDRKSIFRGEIFTVSPYELKNIADFIEDFERKN